MVREVGREGSVSYVCVCFGIFNNIVRWVFIHLADGLGWGKA